MLKRVFLLIMACALSSGAAFAQTAPSGAGAVPGLGFGNLVPATSSGGGGGGGGGGGTGGGTILLQVNGTGANPYYTQAASIGNVYTPLSMTIAGGTFKTNQSINLLISLGYVNSTSDDTPTFAITYGGVNLASGTLPNTIPNSGSPIPGWLECYISANGVTSNQYGMCRLTVGNSSVLLDANLANVDSTTNQTLAFTYQDSSSSNSTINLWNAILSTGVSGGTPAPPSPPSGSGTVNSVGLALPSIFTVSGGPVTTSGTLVGTLNSQTAHTVFAGPASGSPGGPGFRLLQNGDLPNPLTNVLSSTAANPAQTGLVRDSTNNPTVVARNNTNTADITEISTDASNDVVVGDGLDAANVILQNPAVVANGSLKAGAFWDIPALNNAFAGGTDNCQNKAHDYTLGANFTLTVACPTGANAPNFPLTYYFIQPSSGSTFTWAIAAGNGGTVNWIGGTVPTPCSTLGCIDVVNVTFIPQNNVYVAQYIGNTPGSGGTGGGSTPGCPATGYTCYYVAAAGSGGSDANSGTSSAAPWLTISHAMATVPWGPGIALLFKTGDTWTSQQMSLNGLNGSATLPIIIGSYGTAARPIFDENNVNAVCFAGTGAAFKFLTIQGIECEHATNMGFDTDFTGETSTTAVHPGVTLTNLYIHNIGPGCSTTGTSPCLGNDPGGYFNMLNYENTSACVNTANGCVGDGIQFTNNIVRYAGGHNCIEVHGDYGAFNISGNVVGPGCNHQYIDTKFAGSPTKVGTITNNVVDSGASLSLEGNGAAGIYTENDWNGNSTQIWSGNVVYDTTLGMQVCSSDNQLPCGSGTCTECFGTCNLNLKIYNNTIYAFFGVNGQYGLYGPYCGNNTPTGTATLDVRNNIWDGSGFAYTHPQGNATLTFEDFNDSGGKQGQATWFTKQASGAHDKINVDPLYVSPGYNAVTSGTPANFNLQQTSPLLNAGQSGLVSGNNNIGAY